MQDDQHENNFHFKTFNSFLIFTIFFSLEIMKKRYNILVINTL